MVRVDAVAVDGRPLKRARRRDEADGMLGLPDGISAGEIAPCGPFRHCARYFIARQARVAPPALPRLRTWRMASRVGDTAVDLDVVEEDVARSRRIYCDHCRIVGWSTNPVCSTRYHFIIRNESSPSSSYEHHPCRHCGAPRRFSELSLTCRCSTCNYESTSLDLEDWASLQLEDPTHLLHGVVHANGYGHLLRVNGREGGSKNLIGCDLMEYWDRLCKLLNVRKISVMDVSKKHGMEFRLLQAVTAGQPWYGNWGYQFGTGSFGHTTEAYRKAVDGLSSTPLLDDRSLSTQLQKTIALYVFLSPRRLKTLRDLFCFITQQIKDCYDEKNSGADATEKPEDPESLPMCTWRQEDINRAENAIIKILQAVKESKWVTWRALRGATFSSIGSLELLDYCLRKLAGRAVADGLVVAVKCNAESNSVEYRLEHASDERSSARRLCRPSKECLLHDLRVLYDALLNPATMQPYEPRSVWEASRSSSAKILDCKQFIKHYDKNKDLVDPHPFTLRVWCRMELADKPKNYLAPPPELLLLPLHATVADLKSEATKAFQETYLILQSFQAEQVLVNGEDADDATQISFLLGPDDSVQVRGRCLGGGCKLEQLRMERGTESWTVDCTCGTKDDDGERMLACDRCGVWKHTRCSGIDDLDEVPAKFVCGSCLSMSKRGGRGRRMYRYDTSSSWQDDDASSNTGRDRQLAVKS
ncbi:PHD finger protein At1g33420-like isoform X1 [Musa acuminata AAA Group]|uniref:PHD finger protein At1g33420-like isoform X1 n=1 Tax=Musa acuminata AAA Group TaxID=214697 RepID=UPI0031E10C92